MANKKISALAAAGALTGAEIVPGVQSGVTKGLTTQAIAALSSRNVLQSLTFGATTEWDLDDGNVGVLNLTNDAVLDIQNLPTGVSFGILHLNIGGSGSYELTLPEASKVPAGFAISTAAGKKDLLGYMYDGTNFWWDIVNDYEDAEGAPPSLTYLTWETLHINCGQYNSNKGLNKIAGGDGFAQQWSNETLSNGERFVVKVDGISKARLIGINPTRAGAPSSNNVDFNIYIKNTNTAASLEDATPGGESEAVVDNKFFGIAFDAGQIKYQHSLDGVSWTTMTTSGGSPSGAYYMVVELYEQNATHLDEIYKMAI